MDAALADADANEAVRVVVITGAGGAFCAGADLKALAEREPGVYLAWAGDAEGPTHPTLMKPVIAAVNGAALC